MQRGLTYSLPLFSASRLNPSMSLASLRLHSPCPPADGLAVAWQITILSPSQLRFRFDSRLS